MRQKLTYVGFLVSILILVPSIAGISYTIQELEKWEEYGTKEESGKYSYSLTPEEEELLGENTAEANGWKRVKYSIRLKDLSDRSGYTCDELIYLMATNLSEYYRIEAKYMEPSVTPETSRFRKGSEDFVPYPDLHSP